MEKEWYWSWRDEERKKLERDEEKKGIGGRGRERRSGEERSEEGRSWKEMKRRKELEVEGEREGVEWKEVKREGVEKKRIWKKRDEKEILSYRSIRKFYACPRTGLALLVNNNVISLITDKCSFEWAFSKILCRNSETINLLESLFCKKNLKNMSPKKYVDLIYEHIDMLESKMNLFVVYFEIIKHLNNIAETNIYYYELCGISAYLFSQLSMFTSYRASLNINSFIPRSAELEMKNMQKSMLILYYCVRLVEFSVKSNVNCFNHTINDLIYRSLKQINDCSFNLIFKVFDCIKKIRLMFQKQPSSKLTMKYFKYFRCYILPFSVYSEKYINDISLLLSKTDYCPIIEDFELFCDIEGFYKLTMFLVTK